MSLHNLTDTSYFDLNNEINIPVNGQIPLQKDQEALQAFLDKNVGPNLVKFDSLKDRFDYLISHNYYEKDFISQYDFSFIEKLYAYLKEQGFHFKSFMAAYKFYAQYALKTNDNDSYLETFLDRVAVNALYFADGDENLAMNLADEIIHQRYQPATPSFLNAGRENRGEFVSCFLIQTTDDMNTIGRTINSALQLSRIGGGVGINLSNLRAAGDPIKHIEGAASGVVPVMKLLEDSFSYSNQLGQRQGAGVVYLSVFHPDIISFLGAKKENADEKIRLKTLSLGVTVPDKFYELIKRTPTCIYLAHTTWNVSMVNHFHTLTSQKSMTTWLLMTISRKQRLKRGTLKLKSASSNKNPATHISSILIQPTGLTRLMGQSS